MRNRTTLALMEQSVMLLVFALCAALCLGVFLEADALAQTAADRDKALVQAQNAAEAVIACRGDLTQLRQLLGGTLEGETLRVTEGERELLVTCTESDRPGLGTASVTASAKGQPLLQLTAAWQEVTP